MEERTRKEETEIKRGKQIIQLWPGWYDASGGASSTVEEAKSDWLGIKVIM